MKLYLYYSLPLEGADRPGSSEVTMSPYDTLGREFDPGKRIFLTKKLESKNKNAQRVENV